MQWILSGMVAIGALILTFAVRRAQDLSQMVPSLLRWRWRILTILIGAFILGYCSYLFLQFSRIAFPLEVLISIIFFCGALFVFGIVSLTDHTLHQLKQLHDNLELEVHKRTEQLNESNLSLTQSQKELVLQNTFLYTVINALPHPFLVINADTYEIVLANTAVGFASSELRYTCHALSHGSPTPCQGKDHPCPIIEIRKTNKPMVVEHTHFNERGDKRIVEVHGYPIFDESSRLTTVIEYSIDVTDKKQTEVELINARSCAEAASRSKGIFLANMSHEIRTPLNGIIGMNHLAMQATDDEKRQKYLKTVQTSAGNLLDLVNDILDFSKIEAGQLQLTPRPFQLSRLIDDVISTTNFSATEKGLVLKTALQKELPTHYRGDDLRIRQILINLVGNAIKFTRIGLVQISVEGQRCENNQIMLHVAVSDTGIGISPDKYDTIFNSFEQADNSHSRQYGGTGLGLAICKQLVLLMGGNIWVTSEVGNGSVFHIELPLAIEQEHAEGESQEIQASMPPQAKGLRILVVDDNEVNRDVASIILEQDHHVKTARDGLEALSLIADEYFDLVLMDVQMPIMDGLAAAKAIRAAEQGRDQVERLPGGLPGDLARQLFGCHTPIVAMTAHAMREDKMRCLDAGMDGYITKPFQPSELAPILSKLMANVSLQQTGL